MACTGIDLFFQVTDVRVHVGSFGVTLRIAGSGNVEPAEAADIADEVGSVDEVHCRLHALYAVAPESQHIFDAVFLKLFQNVIDLLLGIVDTGQMCHRQYAVVLFQPPCNGEGVFPVAAAAGTKGHADEVRLQIL